MDEIHGTQCKSGPCCYKLDWNSQSRNLQEEIMWHATTHVRRSHVAGYHTVSCKSCKRYILYRLGSYKKLCKCDLGGMRLCLNSIEGNWQRGAELLTTYCQASMPKKVVNKSTAMWRNCASVTSTLWRREERGGERREEKGEETYG